MQEDFNKKYKKGSEEYTTRNYEAAKNIFAQLLEQAQQAYEKSQDSKILLHIAKLYYNLGSSELHLSGQEKSAYDHLREACTVISFLKEESLKSKYHLRTQRAFLHYYLSQCSITRSIGKELFANYSLLNWYQKNLPRLSEIFEKYFQSLKKELQAFDGNEPYTIISLGCGMAAEFYALLQFLGDDLFSKIQFIGLDLNENDINLLRKISQSSELTKQLIFIQADASNIDNLREVSKADCIIVRHPQILSPLSPGNPFLRILSHAVPFLTKPDGKTRVLLTTYDEEEYECAKNALGEGGVGTFQFCQPLAIPAIDTDLSGVEKVQEAFVLFSDDYQPRLQLSASAVDNATAAGYHPSRASAFRANPVDPLTSSAASNVSDHHLSQSGASEIVPRPSLGNLCRNLGIFAVGSVAAVAVVAVTAAVAMNATSASTP
ncbi:MAG: hypothetical protein K0Q74_320 [Gammaproteobacteria bacterium]|nr:hypothetical protein [Gammaproteobacteria bacterium]